MAEKEPLLAEDLERLVEPVTRGDPESVLSKIIASPVRRHCRERL